MRVCAGILLLTLLNPVEVAEMMPMWQCVLIPVLGGFVGATREGVTTTLGIGAGALFTWDSNDSASNEAPPRFARIDGTHQGVGVAPLLERAQQLSVLDREAGHIRLEPEPEEVRPDPRGDAPPDLGRVRLPGAR